jgi:hypothetical protein
MPPLAFLLLGIVIGAAGALFGPSVAPQVTRNLRPTAKAVAKTALEVGHALRVRAAELSEDIEDFVAEARAEATTPPDDATSGNTTPAADVAQAPAAKRAASKKRASRRRKAT